MSARPRQPDVLPMQDRFAPVTSINVEARTLDIVWTTGAAVRRSYWSGWDTLVPFDEELVVSAEAIDLTRMRAGAPVLDSHATYTTSAIRAVVDKVWLADGQGLATIRFPAPGIRPASDELFELARDRIIPNISVGYTIDRVRVIEPEKKGDIERRIVERWTPCEVSFVTIPADAGAQVRSGVAATYPVEILGRAAPGIGAASAARTRMNLRARAAGLSA